MRKPSGRDDRTARQTCAAGIALAKVYAGSKPLERGRFSGWRTVAASTRYGG
jgi:hypothetical protein